MPKLPDCAVCGAPALRVAYPIRDLVLEGEGEWSFAECASCGHGQIAPIPDGEALGALYAELYTPERVKGMEAIGGSGWERRVQALRLDGIRAALGGQAPARVVDVGCGLGHFLAKLGDAFPEAEVTGVEVNAAAAATARARSARVRVVEEPFEAMTPPEGGVDVLCMNHLLEHLPRPSDAVETAARWVRPGGVVELEVPRGDGFGRRTFGRWWWGHLPPQHLHLLTADGLVKLLAKAGFSDVVTLRSTAYPLTATVTLVLFVRFTVGSRSRFARNWLVRGPVVLAGLAALPAVLLFDLFAAPFSAWRGQGDVITVVARRDGR